MMVKTMSRGINPLLITGVSQGSAASKLTMYSFKRTSKIVKIIANKTASLAEIFPFSDINQIPVGSCSYSK
jgi:hypothetical protein